jgi:hypothetical protein
MGILYGLTENFAKDKTKRYYQAEDGKSLTHQIPAIIKYNSMLRLI